MVKFRKAFSCCLFQLPHHGSCGAALLQLHDFDPKIHVATPQLVLQMEAGGGSLCEASDPDCPMQLMYGLLEDEFKNGLYALSMNLKTTEEHKAK